MLERNRSNLCSVKVLTKTIIDRFSSANQADFKILITSR